MKKAICLMVMIGVLCLTACSGTAENSGTALQPEENNATEEVKEEEIKEATGFFLRHDGVDTGIEILFEDCICEYDKGQTKVYSYYVNHSVYEQEGFVFYIQTAEDTMEIFPVKNYLMDQDGATLYMIWGNSTFERIQGVCFQDSIDGYKVASVSSMESLIGEAYGLTLQENDNDFADLQVAFQELYETDKKKVLRGNASALYQASGERYSIEWEIDTDSCSDSAKAYLSDFDMHPLYIDFLRNELSVDNPFVTEKEDNPYAQLSFFDDRQYAPEDVFSTVWKSFALVDVNNDGNPELVFRMYSGPDELMYILGVLNNELICFDIFEGHTAGISFYVYDNGFTDDGWDYDAAERVVYTYTDAGKAKEVIHFVKESADRDDERWYDYYYLDGNESSKYSLQTNEEYEELIAPYRGEEPKWFYCEEFADTPQ